MTARRALTAMLRSPFVLAAGAASGLGFVALAVGLSMAGVSVPTALVISAGAALIAALPATIAVAYLVRGLPRVVATQRQVLADTAKTRATLNKVAQATAKDLDTAATVAMVRKRVDALADASEHRQAQAELQAPVNPFNPQLVKASAVTSAASKSLGRAGAAITDDPHSAAKLARLVSGHQKVERPLVALVASDELARALAPSVRIHRVRPGYGRADIDPMASYLVIEDRALTHGAWSGALQANGFELFSQIVEIAGRSRAAGTVVVFVDTGLPPGQFTLSLKEAARVVITDGDITFSGDQTRAPRLLRSIADATARSTR